MNNKTKMDPRTNNRENFLLQKNRLYVAGFGGDQCFKDIYQFCMENGRETIKYMTKYGDHAAFLTYEDEIVAEKAMNNFKLNHIRVNYARLHPNHVARMQSNGFNVIASPQMNPEKTHYTRFEPGSLVRIIKITESADICVIMKSDMELYKQFLNDLNKKAGEMQPLNEVPRCQELVVASFDGNFHRGLVLKTIESDPEFVHIFLMDIAKRMRTHYTALKRLPIDFRSSAGFGSKVRFVHQFHLARLTTTTIQEGSYASKCCQHFKGTEWEITPSDGLELKTLTDVELNNPNYTITSLNSILKKLSEESFTVNSLVDKKASVGSNKTLVVIDNSNLKNDSDNMITFVERQDLELFVSTQDLIQRCGNAVDSLPAYSPNLNDLCIVKIESLWYRAVFNEENETHSDEAWVQLIDNSVLVSVKKENIRPINGTCVKPEIVSFVGKLDGYGDKIDAENIDDLCRRFKNEAIVTVKAVKDVGDVVFAIEN